MPDRIVRNPDWSFTNSTKGKTKYKHLLDGNAREIDIRDYGFDNIDSFRVTITTTARINGYISRSRKVDEWHLLFQVTGKRESE